MDLSKALKIFMDNFINSNDEQIYNNLKQITKIQVLNNKSILFIENQLAEYFYYVVDGKMVILNFQNLQKMVKKQ